jgi:hypothetical protein
MVLRNHLFNCDYAQLSSRAGLIKIDVLSTLKKPLANKGEDCVVASPIKNFKTGLTFDFCGKIVNVVVPQPASKETINEWPNPTVTRRPVTENNPFLLHSFSIQEDKPLWEHNQLDDLSYSLISVEDFAKPLVHFQHAHRTLPPNDYLTIRNGWVYLARTAFGKLANALPLENRLELKIRLLQELKVEDRGPKDYSSLLQFLLDYIETRILSRGRHLVSANNKLHQVFKGSQIPFQFGLEDPNTPGQTDLVHEQALLFENLFRKANPQILNELRNMADDNRFSKIFKRRPLPLNLLD